MSSDNRPQPVQIPSPQSPVVQGGAPVEIQAIASLVKGFVEPLAHSQEIGEIEKTKRAKIEADIVSTVLRYSFALAAVLVAIAVIALFRGKDQLTEKIVFAVVGFIGGVAFGKSAPRSKD